MTLYIDCQYAECRDSFIVTLNVVKLSVIMPNVIMPNVVVPFHVNTINLNEPQINVILYWQLVSRMKSLQQTGDKILQSEKIIIMADLMIQDYPSVSIINIFSNSQIYWRRHHLFAATLSLSLCYLVLSPHSSIEYLTLACPTIMIIE